MRILVDAQLPPALVRWLREAGHEAIHVQEVDLRESNDDDLWNYGRENETIIMTKDEDFAARSARVALSAPRVVWLRIGNATNRGLREWIEPRLPGILQLLEDGNRLIEVR